MDTGRLRSGVFRKFLTSAAAGTALVAASSLAFTSAAYAAAAAPTSTVRAALVRHQESPAAAPASDIAPGASIGTAWPPLKGGTVYSESLTYTGGDWYALYKQPDSAIGTITVTDTSSESLNCTGVLAQVFGVDGASDQIGAAFLGANQADTFTVPGTETSDPQGRYYVEISPNCGNGLPDGQTYTVEPEPAAQWANPARVPFAKALAPGASVGTAWPPLQGRLVYSDSLTQGEDWYALYKRSTSAVASIRVVNTTVNGSLACTGVLARVFGVNGASDQIDAAFLGANQADTFTVPGTEASDPQGRYYVEISPNCGNGLPDGQTYTVEPEPAPQWANPARVPSAAADPATSIGGSWPPLSGGVAYSATLSAAQDWYALYKRSTSAVASIRVVNTTVDGSLACTSVLAQVLGAGGAADQVASAFLGANQADTFTVPGTEAGDPQGRYYVEITPNCGNGLPDGQTYTVEPEPASQWGNSARALPFGPSKKSAAGPLAGGVNYAATVPSKGVQDWSYFTAKGAATVRVQDTSASTARCDLAVTAGSSSVRLAARQVATLHVAKAGTYYLELTAAAGCAPKSPLGALLELTGSIRGPVLTVTDPALKAGVVKKAYAATISVTGGRKPYVFAALTPLPPGLRLNKTTGAITGKPTKAGMYKVMITVTDSAKPAHDIITTPVTIAIT